MNFLLSAGEASGDTYGAQFFPAVPSIARNRYRCENHLASSHLAATQGELARIFTNHFQAFDSCPFACIRGQRCLLP